jgi:hypothetical protein
VPATGATALAAASAAVSSSVAALNSSLTESLAAATTLGATITTQVNEFLTIGRYSAAASLLTTTLQQLRDSTAFKSGDPTVIALVEQLVALQQKAISGNPATTASAAAASAANSAAHAGLRSTDSAVFSKAALTLGNDISGQISKINREIKNLAVANATYITNKAIGKDVTGMPSAESIVTNINTRIQTELKEIMEKASKAIMGKLAIPAPVSGPNYVGGFKTGKTGKTLKKVSVLHRTKTHRRSAVVSKV